MKPLVLKKKNSFPYKHKKPQSKTSGTPQPFNRWQIASVFIPLATPIAVAVLVAYLAHVSKIEEERRTASALIAPYFEALTGTNIAKREFAQRTLRRVLPEDIADDLIINLPTETSQSIPDADREAALEATIEKAFSKNGSMRQSAYVSLNSSPNQEQVSRAIASYIVKHYSTGNLPPDGNGIANVINILSRKPAAVLKPLLAELEPALQIAQKNGPRTQSMVDAIRLKAR